MFLTLPEYSLTHNQELWILLICAIPANSAIFHDITRFIILIFTLIKPRPITPLFYRHFYRHFSKLYRKYRQKYINKPVIIFRR